MGEFGVIAFLDTCVKGVAIHMGKAEDMQFFMLQDSA